MYMSKGKAEILLACVIIARSTSYLLAKLSLSSIGPFNLLALRFLISFIILSIIFYKKLRNTTSCDLFQGVILGVVLYSILSLELHGLKTITSSMASFIENTAIVFVPFFEAILLKKLPKVGVVLTTLVTLFGVGLLTMENASFSFSFGEVLCFGAAILYAAMIILTAKFSHRGDPITLGIVQIFTVGFLGLISSFIFEQPHLPSTNEEWAVIMSLALVCTVFGFTFQPLAQKYTSTERAGQFCALNPVTAAVLGWIFLNESMNKVKILGALLIIGGVLYTSLRKDDKESGEEQLESHTSKESLNKSLQ